MEQNNKTDSESISNYKKDLLDQTFRDSVATISKEGNRNYVNPQKPNGKLYNLRSYFSYFYKNNVCKLKISNKTHLFEDKCSKENSD